MLYSYSAFITLSFIIIERILPGFAGICSNIILVLSGSSSTVYAKNDWTWEARKCLCLKKKKSVKSKYEGFLQLFNFDWLHEAIYTSIISLKSNMKICTGEQLLSGKQEPEFQWALFLYAAEFVTLMQLTFVMQEFLAHLLASLHSKLPQANKSFCTSSLSNSVLYSEYGIIKA